MRSSMILGVVLLLAIAAPSVVQAHKAERPCGSLGPGINACKCGEIVVKAAKVPKPLFYASPEAINEAAVAREAVGKLFTGANQWQSAKLASFPRYNPFFSGTSSSSSSASASASSSFSSASSLSSGILAGSHAHSPFNSASGKVTSSCGCGKSSESLEVRDLLSSHVEGKVVPSFQPIGDLCYPNQPNSKFQVTTTKVTPAHPGKIKCVPNLPYEVCVNVLNGQIDQAGLRRLGLTTGGLIRGSASGFGTSSNVGLARTATQYGSFAGYRPPYLGSSASSSASASASSGTYGSGYGFGSYTGASAGSSTYGSGYGSRSYAGAGAGSSTYGYGSGSYAGAGAGSSTYGYGSGLYAGAGAASTARSFQSNVARNVDAIQESALSYRSGCGSNDFGDVQEFPEDYSYPRLPADPVSVTLAYKNLFPRTVYYNRRAFVPEDKLAFGHRTIPIESAPGKNVPDVPEEKLQVLDKPVVELKPLPPTPTIVGAYDEREEAKLAELEAVERERINQEEIAGQQQEHFITYGDLGYAPINRRLSAGPIGVLNTIDEVEDEPDCGPVGPPDPDYVPGSVVIDREIVDTRGDDTLGNIEDSKYGHRYAGDEASYEDDDSEDSTSGIFARLRSVARKHGPPCGAV